MLFCLRSLCKINGADSDSMREFKYTFLTILYEKCVSHPLQKLLTLVEPVCKYLSFVDTDERESVRSEMRNMVDIIVLAHSIYDESASMNVDSIGESSCSEQPSKRRKVETETYDLLSRLL
jgi:hypothetical protein